MSKCKKVKNPCKICLGPVSQKTGLQCQGACECWVHYTCLNYTPGKIKDIKAGIIKITCPCPDCKTTVPKELRTDEPFSCSNMKCPANNPARCEKPNCPSNSEPPDKMNQTSVNDPPLPPLTRCGTECKRHSHSKVPNPPVAPRLEQRHPADAVPFSQRTPPDSGRGSPKCPSGCSSSTDVPGDYRQAPVEGMPSLRALEQMCNTVGQLTNQLNCLMNKMRQTVQERSEGGGCGGGNRKGCPQKGPKSMCPKPCYCPGNPGRRH